MTKSTAKKVSSLSSIGQWNPCLRSDRRDIYFLPKPTNWVGLTVVNFCTVKNSVQLCNKCITSLLLDFIGS